MPPGPSRSVPPDEVEVEMWLDRWKYRDVVRNVHIREVEVGCS